MKLLLLLKALAVQCPGLAPIQKRCENNGSVDLELHGESDVVLVEHPSVKPSKCLACFVDPRCDLSIKRSIAGDAAAQVFEVVHVLQLGAINKSGWFWSVSVRCSRLKDFGLAKADAQSKHFDASENLSSISCRSLS